MKNFSKAGVGLIGLLITFALVGFIFYAMVVGLRQVNKDGLDAEDRIEAIDRAQEAKEQLERQFYQYP